MMPYEKPYIIVQRTDNLWTVCDANGREVDGLAHADRRNAENAVHALNKWHGKTFHQHGLYLELMPRKEDE